MTTKKIGIEIKKMPSKECEDMLCPFHGNLKLRGKVFTGIVTSDKMRKTVTVEWNRISFIPKFGRYEKKRTKVKAHNPECIDAEKDDLVKIAESRPISKTKNFVVIEITGKKQQIESEEAVEEEKEKIRKGKRKTEKTEEKEKKEE